MHVGRVLFIVGLLAGCQDKTAPSGSPTTSASTSTSTSTWTSTSSSSSNSTSTSTSASASTPAPTSTASAGRPAKIVAQHILVAWKGAKGAPKSVTRSKADAKKRAEEVFAKARGGEDFTALVAPYSDDPGSVDRQGSVGKFAPGDMAPAFSEAAFALKVDEVSAPVETAFGFHVIRRTQ